MRRYDHIDVRVHSLDEARSFYETLLPALGFTAEAKIEGWLQYESQSIDGVGEFFGVVESMHHTANECRIAFWADNPAEVDRLSSILAEAGARHIDGPAYEGTPLLRGLFRRPVGQSPGDLSSNHS
jgi:catechol 2,3-dioxygenase-like lactoylglutathione lyase family enzyme